MQTVVILKTEILPQNWRYTNLRDGTGDGESLLAHHFICENEKNTPVRRYQNEKVSVLSGCSPKAPSLGHKDGDFLSPFQPYFLTLIWEKTHNCGSTSAFREAEKQ